MRHCIPIKLAYLGTLLDVWGMDVWRFTALTVCQALLQLRWRCLFTSLFVLDYENPSTLNYLWLDGSLGQCVCLFVHNSSEPPL